jgi:hypothetical protein
VHESCFVRLKETQPVCFAVFIIIIVPSGVHESVSHSLIGTYTDYMTVFMSDSGPSQAVQEAKARVATFAEVSMAGPMSTAACPEAEAAQTSLLQLQASPQRSQAGVEVVSGSEQLPSGRSPVNCSQLSSPAVPRVDQGQQDANAGLLRLKIVGIPAGARSSSYDTAVAQDQGTCSPCCAVLLLLPAGYSEEQLRSLFQLCGSVAECRIVHDKQSGRPVG